MTEWKDIIRSGLIYIKYEKAFAGVRAIEQEEREKEALTSERQSLPLTTSVESTKTIWEEKQ